MAQQEFNEQQFQHQKTVTSEKKVHYKLTQVLSP